MIVEQRADNSVRTRQPLTSQQVVGHKRPLDPQISPDGRTILFTLRPISRSGEHDECAIWKVDSAGGEPTQFSTGTGQDRKPRWSPDGQRVAFLSDRAERGKLSVYAMPASGGEAVRVFDHQGEIDSLTWSPDGSLLSILYTEPGTDADKKRKEDRDDAKVWDADPKFQRLWVIDPGKKTARCVSPPGQQVWWHAWSPCSERIAINTTVTPRIDDSLGETQLSIITRNGGTPSDIHRPICSTNNLQWIDSPNRLLWIAPAGRVRIGETLVALDLESGQIQDLTPELDGTVESLQPTGSRNEVLVQIATEQHHTLALLDGINVRTDIFTAETPVFMPQIPATDHAGFRIAFAAESGRTPPDLWVNDRGRDRTQRITELNGDLASAALGEVEGVSWFAPDGIEIQGMLYLPFGYNEGRRYPLVVQVHGGPTSRWGNEFTANWHDWAQSLAGRGFAVLLPNPRGSTGRGTWFTNALFNEIGGAVFHDTMAGIDALIERGIADPDKLGIGGWSWGGYMSAWAITQTNRFKAAVVGAGVTNMISDNSVGDIPTANLSYFDSTPYDDPEPYWSRSPMRHIGNVTTPTLILHGEENQRVSMSQGQELYVALRFRGVETQFVTYPRERHSIKETLHQQDLIQRVVGWYTRFLLASEPARQEPRELSGAAP